MVLSGSGRSPPPPTNRRIRLSYGTAASNSHATPAGIAAETPTTNQTEDTHDEGGGQGSSAFLAALSPATAKYLKGDDILNSRSDDHEGDGKATGQHVQGQNNETDHLRSFVRSLLGVSDSASMQTPDPQTAALYATQLYSLTNRIDDAYLAARAMMLNNEEKRAVWLLEGVGLIGARIEGDAAAGNETSDTDLSGKQDDVNENASLENNKSNAEGIRAAIQLRTESSLLAGQCLTKIGEIERALTVYSEAMRYPPVPPKNDWGLYGFGYKLSDSDNLADMDGDAGEDEEALNETYIRQWREQSLSNSALIDEGDDPRLLKLAENVWFLPFDGVGDSNTDDVRKTLSGIHPLARLCAARGMAYDSLSNPHRALPFLKAALQIDARCIEAWDYVIKRKLLTPSEEQEWFDMLNWKGVTLKGMSWLKDAYLIRLRGGGLIQKCPSTIETAHENAIDESRIMDASSFHHGVGLQTPSAFSLGSPDFGKNGTEAPTQSSGTDDSVDQAFRNLAITHHLGKSSDVLSLAAIRSYASHNLQAALTYCTFIDTIDPFCLTAGYVYVATLVGLGLKRRLFELAHRLVDADPKSAIAWFAVGSYYYLCGRYDLSQRHFSRSTRLDPSSAECWIGFGCSFAICDESDQALASFRAAQNKYSGSHIPLLYMGMEYLRTNHLSLAGHFLTSSQQTDPSDPLCCNELGVWAFRRGDMEDAAFWFVKALRLHVGAESSTLTCVDEAWGANGYLLLNNKVNEDALNETDRAVKAAETPFAEQSCVGRPPSTVLCALKTPSGQSIAAQKNSSISDSKMTDLECVDRCKDVFWEPTINNLGQCYRKLQQYGDAIACFEKCSSLNPGSASASSALGFARHLSGDIDGAIDSYHEALSRKPDDQFSIEMLNRALAEAVTYPKSSVFESDLFSKETMRQTSVIGRNVLSAKVVSGDVNMI